MTISFLQFPSSWRVPGHYAEVDPSQAASGGADAPPKVFLFGHRTQQTTAPLRVLTSAVDAEIAYGKGSQIAAMARALFAQPAVLEVTGFGLDDAPASTTALGGWTLAGTATEDGRIEFGLGGVRVPILVANGDTAADIATALAAAFPSDSTFPVTGAVNGGDPNTVDLTVRWSGESGNQILPEYFEDTPLPAGIAITPNFFAGGAGEPDLAPVLADLAPRDKDTLVLGLNDAASLAAVKTHLQQQWHPLTQKYGHAWSALAADFATAVTFGDTQNDAGTTVFAYDLGPSPFWELAAGAAGAWHTLSDPAAPRTGIAINGIVAPAPENRYEATERNLLLFDGMSTLTYDDDGTVRIERVITTYQTNSLGAPDTAFLDTNTRYTLAYLLKNRRAYLQTRFQGFKVANDGTEIAPGQKITTPSRIKKALIAWAYDMEELGLVEEVAAFASALRVERHATDKTRVDSLEQPDIINPLLTHAALIQFIV